METLSDYVDIYNRDTRVTRRVHRELGAQDRQVLEVTLAALVSRLEPCRRETIIGGLARLSNHHRQDRSPGEWKALFDDYCGDLAEFSEIHILQALNEHRRASKWFPKVAELRERAIALRELDLLRQSRCKRLLGMN